MSPARWIVAGCVLGALAVALGAFGAHAWKETLEARGTLANWETAVRFQLVHALALVVFALFRERHPGKALPGWMFFLGATCFSGSLYLLCFGIAKSLMGPITPLGGVMLIGGWLAFAIDGLRAR
jgi:uncharacterized membrane protein YgdD (TMEM256/DUF423 family)